jgi:capsid protein
MSEAPYKIRDRRGTSNGWGRSDLFDAAAPRNDERTARIPQSLDRDGSALMGQQSRVALMRIARYLCANFPQVRNAVAEMATYTTASFIPQFEGADKAWGEQAEALLREHDRILDIRGAQWNRDHWLRGMVASAIRDGDSATLLVDRGDGYPQIQCIPGHRLGCRAATEVMSGSYKGLSIVDGVIIDDFGTVIAHRITGNVPEDDRDVSTADIIPHWIPDVALPDQVRGISWIGSVLIQSQDVKERRRLELAAMKLAASEGFLVENEDGQPELSRIVPDSSVVTDAAATPVAPVLEMVDGPGYRYAKAQTGQKITAITSDRPTVNQQVFEDGIIREILASMGWSSDFSFDPTKVASRQMFIVIAKINANMNAIRRLMVEPACRRLDGWRISKFIKRGDLPPNPEWYKWGYQHPADLTADEKYSSDTDLQEWRGGGATMADFCGKRGKDWRETIDQSVREEKYRMDACAAAGVPYDRVRLLTPNGSPVDAVDATDPTEPVQ